ncbi:hypothetical protein K0M31_016299, partial [Melipona bicolor]
LFDFRVCKTLVPVEKQKGEEEKEDKKRAVASAALHAINCDASRYASELLLIVRKTIRPVTHKFSQ